MPTRSTRSFGGGSPEPRGGVEVSLLRRFARSVIRHARGTRPEQAEHAIRPGYRRRRRPSRVVYRRWPSSLFKQTSAIVWQPDVYATAEALALELGSRRIIDIGCGDGAKLSSLSLRFEAIGLDLPRVVARARQRYPDVIWIEHDLESAEPLPLDAEQLSRSVVVTADVIEHLRSPRHLLGALRLALEHCDAVVLSTPERELTWGFAHNGPPPNPAHVREWNQAELLAFLRQEGFNHGRMELTRPHDHTDTKNTIMVTLTRSGEPLAMPSR